MATDSVNRIEFWTVVVSSEPVLSEKEKEFIVQLFNEEAWKRKDLGLMLLHNVLETQQECQLIVEANKSAIENLVEVFKDNLNLAINTEQ